MKLSARIAQFFSTRAAVDPKHPRDPALSSIFGGGSVSSAGVSVTPESALRVEAVHACVRVLAETLAALPIHVYRRTASGGKERATDHPLYRILHLKPNDLQTSFEWRETHVAHTALRGESYSRIEMNGAGQIAGLTPLHPDRVWPFMTPAGKMAYRYTPETGGTIYYLDGEILRLPWLNLDPRHKALSPIALHRETIGAALVSSEYQARLFGNSAVPKGGLKVTNPLSPEARNEIRKEWNDKHRGVENAGNIAIFHGGLEWVNIGMTHEDAQYVELQGLSVTAIARIFGVPPHKIADLSKATFSNIEQQAIEFVTDTVLPWVRRWEDRMTLSLLSPAEQQSFFIGFDLKGLLRGDSAARAALYRVLFQIGALTPNDARRLEDMDPLVSPLADESFMQISMSPLSRLMDVLMKPGVTPTVPPDDAGATADPLKPTGT
jgi:HK97 family phage portal protein